MSLKLTPRIYRGPDIRQWSGPREGAELDGLTRRRYELPLPDQ